MSVYFRQEDGWTILRCDSAMNPLVIAFMCTWFALVIGIGVLAGVAALADPKTVVGSLWSFYSTIVLLLVFGALLVLMGASLARDEPKFLVGFVARVVDGEIIQASAR